MKNKVQIYGVVGLLVGGAIAAAGIIPLLLLGGEDNQEEIQLAIGKLTGEARKSFMR
ncbi:hypothetical protein NDI37_26510 [Funiculus sociatus GB2-A5]|uniref:YtxH domain-containing protein n=1 Tax=Funiculus sociatus GB2-A5 TaxID=2933946 RepID=A0ABV0JXA8_9CYAN|nr:MULTISPECIES: hypothetical protein [unclassified Trichocoleus]MBD1905678.1 hypothetical protein [Trichocoleus sp. FACHB-832]MBD2064895.1 hypothetical protein [Trichocoleus sp. FACHB-6]